MSASLALGTHTSIEELIGGYKQKRISRGSFLAALTAAGVSATVAATLLSATDDATAPVLAPATTAAAAGTHHRVAGAATLDPGQAHARHIAEQVAGTTATTPAARAAAVAKIMGDYSPNAVVNDPLFGAPLVGAAAIAVHKTAEMAAISNVSLDVLTRAVVADQVISTWQMSGIHDGPFYTYQPTGNRIELKGMTVQSRGRDGKITSETLYYDAVHMHRQLSGGR